MSWFPAFSRRNACTSPSVISSSYFTLTRHKGQRWLLRGCYRTSLVRCNVINLPLGIMEITWVCHMLRTCGGAPAAWICTSRKVSAHNVSTRYPFSYKRKHWAYPHKLVLMTMLWAPKNWSTGQVVVLQKADGAGHVEGLGAKVVRSSGVVARLKCQTRIPTLSHSIAKTAPPLFPMPAPKEAASGSVTPQPEFELA